MHPLTHYLIRRAALGAVLFCTARAALASDILVPSGGSIQAAIDAAVDGDRVLVPPGTYHETISFLGKAIEVVGTSGPAVTTLDATGLDAPVVSFWEGEGPLSILRGLTVLNGDNHSFPAGFGGGISGWYLGSPAPIASPTVVDCIIRGCSANWGAGAFTNGTLRRCVIAGNGLASLDFGGGVAGESMSLVECVLADNYGYEGGGALRRAGPGTASFVDCVIVENRAGEGGKGAGLLLEGPTLVQGCLIARNAITWGGMFGNSGSGIHAPAPGVLVQACTVADNQCTPSFFGPNTGGITGAATVVGCIVRGNCELELDLATAGYSDVKGGWPGAGNFDAEPLFVDAPGGDYHLRAGSPCIDAGSPLALDPDGTPADVGAHFFRSLYPRDNATAAQWAAPAWKDVSGLFGGKAAWRVHAGETAAGDVYALAGSLSGTSPGTPVLGVVLPLVLDGYFLFTVNHANQPPFSGSLGVLNGLGNGDVLFTLPAGQTTLIGITAWHAAVVVDLASLTATLATNAVELQILP